MRLINTNHRVPGGWRYEQFSADGRLLKKFASFDPYAMFLGKIQDFRRLNHLPRQDLNFVDTDVQDYLAREFGGDPKYFIDDETQKKTPVYRVGPNRLANLVARGRELLSGANILLDWLGEGLKPVAIEEAQSRSDACTGRNRTKPCPHNNPGYKPVEETASIIRSWAEHKNSMNLAVAGEENLHTCDLCWCHLPTKVHVPMDTIIDRTPQAMIDKFASEGPKYCWMRSQTKTPAQP